MILFLSLTVLALLMETIQALGLVRYATITADAVLAKQTPVLDRRITTELSTCGYLNGDPSKPRTADSGFDCRIDTSHGIWGFCPTTVISATDCGLAGACVDSNACSRGCGISNNPSVTTFTCTGLGQAFCSTALLTFGVDQTYAYLACAAGPATDHLLISPTAASSTSVLSSSTATTISSSSSQSQSSSSSQSQSSSLNTPASVSSSTASSQSAITINTSAASSGGINSSSSGSSNNTGAIIGGVIGGLALLCICIIAVVYIMRRSRNRDEKLARPSEDGHQTSETDLKPDSITTRVGGGWGPQELPTCKTAISYNPVELPANNER